MKLALILALIVAFNVWDWRHPLRLALDAIERAEKRRRAQRIECGPWSLRLGECYDLRPPRSVWGYR